jgi:5'-deoxynucleotidase YfbR-like HD superfamily hydrolase
MPFAYYQKLSTRHKTIYRDSDQIEKIELPQLNELQKPVAELEKALESGRRLTTQKAAQNLMDRLTAALGVSAVSVKGFERRPSWATGELHGLYEARERGSHTVSVWMRTAQRAQVVKFKTFLRTLLHELCHHLDYEHFQLGESFHTEGFFKRESSLLRQLYPST